MSNTVQGSSSTAATNPTSKNAQDSKLDNDIQALEGKINTLEKDISTKLEQFEKTIKKAELKMEQLLIMLADIENKPAGSAKSNKTQDVELQVAYDIMQLNGTGSDPQVLADIQNKVGQMSNNSQLQDLLDYVSADEGLSANNQQSLKDLIQTQMGENSTEREAERENKIAAGNIR